MNASIKLGPMSRDAQITVDGKELSSVVGALRLTRTDGAVSLIASPETLPTLELTIILESVDVDVDGCLLVNATPVSDTIGRAVYESLKQRYE